MANPGHNAGRAASSSYSSHLHPPAGLEVASKGLTSLGGGFLQAMLCSHSLLLLCLPATTYKSLEPAPGKKGWGDRSCPFNFV